MLETIETLQKQGRLESITVRFLCSCVSLTDRVNEQMMFVAGETGEPTTETTTLVEQIVHEQVVEMVSHFASDINDF